MLDLGWAGVGYLDSYPDQKLVFLVGFGVHGHDHNAFNMISLD
jgi:hypothetical protein